MDLSFPVKVKIAKPVSEVFDAVYNPKKLAGYFTTGGASAPMDEGTTVMWDFADFPGAFPVDVKNNKENELLVFQWSASDGNGKPAGYNTKVEMKFKAVEGGTLLEIIESGWKADAFKAAAGNAQGWMNFACCLKAYAEYNINLRKNFF